MFIVTLTYKQPLEIVDQHLAEHRAYLEEGYRYNFFVTSGPKKPRNGAIIISNLKDREQLEGILKEDPFNVNGVTEYDIVEFTPTKYHTNFACFI
ncbi:MAG: GTP cyclohydrolase [Gammaproteobacteria bacterium]|nr:GTP cyclohydrolase [Gammaproteobacteria bacterium]